MLPVDLLTETAAYLPKATPDELFRTCLMICQVRSIDQLHALCRDPDQLTQVIEQLQLQQTLYEDQQAALAEELDGLASTQPCEFNMSQLWTLIRAIKVQSQLLELYAGPRVALGV